MTILVKTFKNFTYIFIILFFIPSCSLQNEVEPDKIIDSKNINKKKVNLLANLKKLKVDPMSSKKILVPVLKDIVGIDRNQLITLLGKPSFRRYDKPSDLWQYRNKECSLDIFLYSSNNIYKVTHASIRIFNKSRISKFDCFKEIIKNETTYNFN